MRVGLIPARGGSKGIPRKNLADLGGRPLIAHSIEAALASRLDAVYVSSDDDEILEVARLCGARLIERPAELASDEAVAASVMLHALDAIERETGRVVCALVYLQPTSPFRTPGDITEALAMFESRAADAVVSVTELPHSHAPTSIMRLEDGRLSPFDLGKEILRRQEKPRLYARNGPAVLVLRPGLLRSSQDLYAGRTFGHVMPRERSLDIDDPFDLALARLIIAAGGPGLLAQAPSKRDT